MAEAAVCPTIRAVFDAPPPDVQALLDSEQGTLAHYFDAQRADALQRAQRDWPQLWRLAPPAS
jgi:hypothetical protein